MAVPFPDPVVVSLLSTRYTALGGRVSLLDTAPVPSAKVTGTGSLEPSDGFEQTPIYQVDIFADDELTAGTIAWEIVNDWPSIHHLTVGTALVVGAWVETLPRILPRTDSNHARYLLEVGIRLTTV